MNAIALSQMTTASSSIVVDLDARVRDDLLNLGWMGHTFFGWLIASSLVVAVGVIFEGPEIVHELTPIVRRWLKKPVKRKPRRCVEDIMKFVGFAGWILVVAGVVGEGIFEGLDSRAQGMLQTFNDISLTAAQNEAAYAIERSADARELADSFQSQIAESNARTKEAEARVASAEAESKKAAATVATADVRIAEAQKSAADATKSAEEERIKRLQLEAQIAPRRLSKEEAIDVIGACRLCAGRSVTIRSYSVDVESGILAKQLVVLFMAARMRVADGTASISPLGNFLIGIHVTGNDELAAEIRRLLSERGHLFVAPKGSESNGGWEMGTGPTDPTDIVITVGPKPIQ